MKNAMIYIWGYNGFGKVNEQSDERYFTSPHGSSKKLWNSAQILSRSVTNNIQTDLDRMLMSNKNVDNVSISKTADSLSRSYTDQEKKEHQPTHICQHDDMTYFVFTNGLCHVSCHGELNHSIVKEGIGTENARLKCVAAGDLHIVGVSTDDCLCGSITKASQTNDYLFRPFMPPVTCQQVSCGKEHVLILSTVGKVYSFGLGSRGQLGHGVTDTQPHPKIIEAIETVSIAFVSAGGWHSAVVSDIHDIYIWGWNESGQLGFKMKTSMGSKVTHHSTPTKVILVPTSHDSSSGTGNDRETALYSHSRGTEASKTKDENLENTEDDCVLFHLVPEILDLPGDQKVLKVSCGARHSAAVTESGHLYTWGWGEYGQLGHGDRCTRDSPTTVQFFARNDLTVTDVICQGWNTVASTKSSLPDVTS